MPFKIMVMVINVAIFYRINNTGSPVIKAASVTTSVNRRSSSSSLVLALASLAPVIALPHLDGPLPYADRGEPRPDQEVPQVLPTEEGGQSASRAKGVRGCARGAVAGGHALATGGRRAGRLPRECCACPGDAW